MSHHVLLFNCIQLNHVSFTSFAAGSNGIDVFDCRFLNRPSSHISCFSSLNLFPVTENMLVQVSAHRIINWVFLGDSWTSNGDITNRHRSWRTATAMMQDDQFLIACSNEFEVEVIKGVSNKLAFAFSSLCSLSNSSSQKIPFYSGFFSVLSNPVVISDYWESEDSIHYYAVNEIPRLCAVASPKLKNMHYSFGLPGSDHLTKNVVIVTNSGIHVESIVNTCFVCFNTFQTL